MKYFAYLLSPAAVLAAWAMPAAAHAALPTPPAILEWQSTMDGWDNSFYWYETDGNRYAFTSPEAYQSWFPGTPTGVSEATIEELAPVHLEGAVHHRPGVRLIKFESSPNVYAVSRFGVLRWLASEQVALELYDEDWKSYVDEVPVTDYTLYRFGSTITDAAEYDIEAYENMTNPSSNAVNATNRPPEKFEATVKLYMDKTDAKVGEALILTAYVSDTKEKRDAVTIRFYDEKDQVVGVCKNELSCSVELSVTGPLGDQAFKARAFNTYEQSVESDPVVVYVANS